METCLKVKNFYTVLKKKKKQEPFKPFYFKKM